MTNLWYTLKKRLAAAPRRSSVGRRRRATTLGVERLDDRAMLSADFGAGLAQHDLPPAPVWAFDGGQPASPETIEAMFESAHDGRRPEATRHGAERPNLDPTSFVLIVSARFEGSWPAADPREPFGDADFGLGPDPGANRFDDFRRWFDQQVQPLIGPLDSFAFGLPSPALPGVSDGLNVLGETHRLGEWTAIVGDQGVGAWESTTASLYDETSAVGEDEDRLEETWTDVDDSGEDEADESLGESLDGAPFGPLRSELSALEAALEDLEEFYPRDSETRRGADRSDERTPGSREGKDDFLSRHLRDVAQAPERPIEEGGMVMLEAAGDPNLSPVNLTAWVTPAPVLLNHEPFGVEATVGVFHAFDVAGVEFKNESADALANSERVSPAPKPQAPSAKGDDASS